MNDDDRIFYESFTTTVMILPKNFLLVNHYPQHNDLCRSSSTENNLNRLFTTEPILSFIGRNRINFFQFSRYQSLLHLQKIHITRKYSH